MSVGRDQGTQDWRVPCLELDRWPALEGPCTVSNLKMTLLCGNPFRREVEHIVITELHTEVFPYPTLTAKTHLCGASAHPHNPSPPAEHRH